MLSMALHGAGQSALLRLGHNLPRVARQHVESGSFRRANVETDLQEGAWAHGAASLRPSGRGASALRVVAVVRPVFPGGGGGNRSLRGNSIQTLPKKDYKRILVSQYCQLKKSPKRGPKGTNS